MFDTEDREKHAVKETRATESRAKSPEERLEFFLIEAAGFFCVAEIVPKAKRFCEEGHHFYFCISIISHSYKSV